jgi:hypothetical protein
MGISSQPMLVRMRMLAASFMDTQMVKLETKHGPLSQQVSMRIHSSLKDKTASTYLD